MCVTAGDGILTFLDLNDRSERIATVVLAIVAGRFWTVALPVLDCRQPAFTLSQGSLGLSHVPFHGIFGGMHVQIVVRTTI